MTIYWDIEQIVSTTHDTCAMLSQFKNWWDALLLYFRYIQQKKMQDNNQTYSTDTFMMQAMKWWKERFYKAKNILKDKWFIEHVWKQWEDGKFQWWYVKVNFVMSISTLPENHSPENQEGGNQETNTPVEKVNAPVVNKNTCFSEFWSTYPHFRTGKKQDAKQHYEKSKLTHEEIMQEVKILKRKNHTEISKIQFNKWCHLWIRDITKTSEVVLIQTLKEIVKIMKPQQIFVKNKELMDDFPDIDIKWMFRALDDDKLLKSIKAML